jgi:diketogulonate reductase-like aldo/keto reductase
MNKAIKLNSGYDMPVIGLGTYKSEPKEVGNAVTYALTEAGYDHIDCASIYQNEKEVGEALKNVWQTRSRDSVFITSKLWNTEHAKDDVEAACRQTLADLGLEYLDLYLMHWGMAFEKGGELQPVSKDGKIKTANVSIRETWEAMQELVSKGLVKSIGVANFDCPMLADLLTYAKIIPATNQIELHPYLPQTDLLGYCAYKNISVTAYSPLGRAGVAYDLPRLADEKIVKDLASKNSKTVAQILLNWGIMRGTIVIPKSVTPSRIKENLGALDFELSAVDIKKLNSLACGRRFIEVKTGWGIPYFN